VELDPVLRESTELRNDLRSTRISEEIAADYRIGSVNRHVQGREPVLDDALDVVLLQVGEGSKVAVTERKPVVVIADVKHIAQSAGQPVNEAEITAIGAAPDSRRFERDPERLF
jgi:hypothetical protein